MLQVENLHVFYDQFEVLKGVSLYTTGEGIVSVIGANGAGKSTLVKAISGLLTSKRGKVIFNKENVTNYAPEKLVRLGMAQVLEGRRIFGQLNTIDNLLLGAYCYHRKKKLVKKNLENVFRIFPVLESRKKQLAGSLSGGEQQMLAFGRALMANPKFLVLDEPSLGLAPIVTEEIFQVIIRLNKEGKPILLIEQNAYAALQICQRGYVLQNGRVVFEGTSQELISNEEVSHAYLGKK